MFTFHRLDSKHFKSINSTLTLTLMCFFLSYNHNLSLALATPCCWHAQLRWRKSQIFNILLVYVGNVRQKEHAAFQRLNKAYRGRLHWRGVFKKKTAKRLFHISITQEGGWKRGLMEVEQHSFEKTDYRLVLYPCLGTIQLFLSSSLFFFTYLIQGQNIPVLLSLVLSVDFVKWLKTEFFFCSLFF